MSRVAIVTDSTAYIPDEYREKFHITSVPLLVIWGQETFEDGITIKSADFYQRLSTSKTMPTTSQASIAGMQKAFDELVAQGYDVLGMFLSAKLSGTFQSAVQARESMTQGKEKVHIFDTETTCMAMGYQVMTTARAAMEGVGLAECIKLAEQVRKSCGLFFMVDTLEFLHRGGRIGGAQRFFGTALNLKPILTVRNGKVEAVERIRTKGKAMERLLELVEENCRGKSPVRLSAIHANAENDAKMLLEQASGRIQASEAIVAGISPVVGTHTGPGTVGLAYLTGF